MSSRLRMEEFPGDFSFGIKFDCFIPMGQVYERASVFEPDRRMAHEKYLRGELTNL